jgi:hypothetical protein
MNYYSGNAAGTYYQCFSHLYFPFRSAIWQTVT